MSTETTPIPVEPGRLEATRVDVRARATSLEATLREQLAQAAPGAGARSCRIELIAWLERAQREDDALSELRDAVRVDLEHHEAWLALADCLEQRRMWPEFESALERAASTARSQPTEVALWRRLSRFASDRLDDEEKAATYQARADTVKQELPPGPLAGPLMVPPPRGARPPLDPEKTQVDFDIQQLNDLLNASTEPEPVPVPRPTPNRRGGVPATVIEMLRELCSPTPIKTKMKSSPGARVPAVEARQAPAIALGPRASAPQGKPSMPPPAVHDDEDEWEGSTVGAKEDEVWEWEAPLGLMSRDGKQPPETVTQEFEAPGLEDSGEPLAPSYEPARSKLLSKEREQLFEHVRSSPLEAEGYRRLAEHFESGGDAPRSSLMLEIARAMGGDPYAAPRSPKLILSAVDRAGLKHPAMRGPEGELLGLCGLAICSLYPTRGTGAGMRDEFQLDSGKGARGAADALLAAVRILGMRAPEVYPSHENGPPFGLVFASRPRLLVGRLAVKKELPGAELRFFAGRALFTQSPDLLCLRSLRREQLTHALSVLGQVLKGQATNAEARTVRDALGLAGRERIKKIYERVSPKMNLAVLTDGARHSANRAGLVVCGAVAPAICSLRAKKARPAEIAELVRFAASERYLALRSRKLGK